MNVLVINCGSSSLKYQLINSDTEAVLAKGLCERIGIDGRLVYKKAGRRREGRSQKLPMPTHKEAIQMVLDALTNKKSGVIASLAEVGAVGHRVVHGGEKFTSSTVITDEADEGNRRVQRSCTASQPGKPDRHPRLPGAYAERTDGSCIRYRFPSDNAGGGLSLRSSVRVL